MKRIHTHSQNFLRSPKLVSELIGHTTIKKNDIVYDIGAGSGIISSVLARRCKKVIAIEIEPNTAQLLRKNMAAYENVTVLQNDFLTLQLPDGPYKIFANIPFHLSSAILQKITEAKNPPRATYLIVQKQFANKLLPDHDGFSSQLGMLLGIDFAFRVRKRLRRTDFWPHPNVDTVLLEIIPRKEPLISETRRSDYHSFIRKQFTTPESFHRLPLHMVSKKEYVKPSSLNLIDWVKLFKAVQ